MRGALPKPATDRSKGRIIPAYAGSTKRATFTDHVTADHPRVCGEHEGHHHQGGQRQGSSPRMRGALRRKLKDPTITGIIPAYAGSTVSGIAGHPTGWDHPRVCGEHDGRNRSRGDRRGSSPRMRGAHAAHLGRVAWPGIIPAYAGSTTSATTIMPNSGDHPRVCGEHTGHPVGQVGGEGSSPRMRGALFGGAI